MKVTFVLKDLSDVFFNGFGESIQGLNKMADSDKFSYLNKRAFERELKITMKIGSANSFRDRVDLNMMLRKEVTYSYKLEPRKGYKLATFVVQAA